MKKNIFLFIIYLLPISYSFSCTNILVTKGASEDGSTMIVYTNDGEWLYRLSLEEAKNHKKGDSIKYGNGKIAQIKHTYGTLGFQMNQHQVAIGETTFVGREELMNQSNMLKYWHLMSLALERAKTAREAINVITSLVAEYGYGSEGESISIADPNEVWILEIIGMGQVKKGAVWVAQKVPDGYISAHANMARIGEFPLDDPKNCLYSKNVISFAIEKGYYNPKSGEPFRFNSAYNPPSPDRLKYCETRVWSIFRRAAPSLNLSKDYHRGVKGAKRYPLFIKPDKKLSLKDVQNLVRDHYEGTEFDMTKGLDAGAFGCPNRWRPLSWEDKKGNSYSWERPISTYNTAFSYIAQCRSWLPNDIGGMMWFGEDDTYFSCYIPIYLGINEIPKALATGDIRKFSWQSAWWVFNFVSNFANIKYSYMIEDIKKAQKKLEDKFILEQDSFINSIKKYSLKKRRKLVTEYSKAATELTMKEWTKLAEHLITKYNDGYIKNKKGKIKSVGYPENWKGEIIKNYPKKFFIPNWRKKKNEKLQF